MKPLNTTQLRMVREMEKKETTYRPKEIWFRAWEIMLENHLTGFYNPVRFISR